MKLLIGFKAANLALTVLVTFSKKLDKIYRPLCILFT